VDTSDLRRRSYALWAWEFGQNARLLAEHLRGVHGLDISDRGVRWWAKQDGWRLRYERDRQDIDPTEARPAIALRLQSAALAAAEYIESVNLGDVQPNKDRIAAAKIALDSVGFSSIRVDGNEAQNNVKITTKRVPTNFATMTREELAERERALSLPAHTGDTEDG
jgi:hypothetical protein